MACAVTMAGGTCSGNGTVEVVLLSRTERPGDVLGPFDDVGFNPNGGALATLISPTGRRSLSGRHRFEAITINRGKLRLGLPTPKLISTECTVLRIIRRTVVGKWSSCTITSP